MVTIENIAIMCHEQNRLFCRMMGDFTQLQWDDAPDWQKESAIEGVKFHLKNPEAKPSASHESWMEHKSMDGWQYGPEKDPEQKLHPCMVPFNKLPPEQQAKDVLFKSVVDALRGLISE